MAAFGHGRFFLLIRYAFYPNSQQPEEFEANKGAVLPCEPDGWSCLRHDVQLCRRGSHARHATNPGHYWLASLQIEIRAAAATRFFLPTPNEPKPTGWSGF
jgi:hypothetical protein